MLPDLPVFRLELPMPGLAGVYVVGDDDPVSRKMGGITSVGPFAVILERLRPSVLEVLVLAQLLPSSGSPPSTHQPSQGKPATLSR